MKCINCNKKIVLSDENVPSVVTPDGDMVCSDHCKEQYAIKLNWKIRKSARNVS